MSKSVSAVQAEQAAARRKRNITIASIVLGVLVVAGIAIALAGGSEDEPKADASNLTKVAETKALLAGIPQDGKILGDPKAKVTVIEFADLQCPFCKQFSQSAFPHLVKDYIRTGKVKVQLETLAFLGPDSLKAGRAAAAAADQGKLWNFTDVFYNNQGTENSGYVTDKYIDAVFDAITSALKKGDDVRLVGFGTFSAAKRKAREGRNPRTGETIQIPASTQPKFSAGKGLKDALN